MIDEFCVIVYLNESSVKIARRLDLNGFGEIHTDDITKGPSSKDLVITKPLTFYASICSPVRLNQPIKFYEITLEDGGTDANENERDTIWKLIADLETNTEERDNFYSDVCDYVEHVLSRDIRMQYTKKSPKRKRKLKS